MRFLLVILIICSSYFSTAQISGASNRGPCFQKSVDRLGKRYVDWECDERDAIVDCNEKLSQEPGSNIVRTRSSGSPYSGDCETCHMNGLRQRIVHFANGKVDGVDTTYYESGCPQVVRNHIEGVENGTWTFYNDTSGLLAWEIEYFNGEKHGQSIYFRQKKIGENLMKVQINGEEKKIYYNEYENDTVKIEPYIEGRLNGAKKEYYKDSKIHKEINYENGVLHGPFLTYDFEGNLLKELNYEEGEKDDTWKYYYNDGSLLRTESWDEGVKDGVFKTFYIQGHIQTMETYKKGMKHGEFMERFPDDKIKREAIYKKDELIEEHVYDKWGNEIRTVDEDGPVENTEDDEVTTKEKKKKWWQFWKKK